MEVTWSKDDIDTGTIVIGTTGALYQISYILCADRPYKYILVELSDGCTYWHNPNGEARPFSAEELADYLTKYKKRPASYREIIEYAKSSNFNRITDSK